MPETADAPATLANWTRAPHSRWGFRHVDALIRTAPIARGPTVTPLEAGPPLDLAAIALADGTESVADVIETSDTDGFLVLHRGRVVAELYRGGQTPDDRRVLFSVSKSITAIVAGIVAGEGRLDPDAPVTRYVPEAAGSAYGDATVRHVLDMTVSIRFVEDYLDPTGDFGRYRVATDWSPPSPAVGPVEGGLRGFLMTLRRGDGPHGARFHYVSPNTDLLGLILERAAGEPFPGLMSRLLWAPLGAERDAFITVDRHGAPRTAGGICVTLRDLARFAEMVRNEGRVGDRRVAPAAWIADIRENGDRTAWTTSGASLAALMPDGHYRSKWYAVGDGALVAIGVYGQWIYIDPAAEMVVVKQSSQPLPVDDPLKRRLLASFRALGEHLAG